MAISTRVGGLRSTLSRILNFLSAAASSSWSTTETETGGLFLGSAVYRKAIVLAAGPNNEELSIAHGIAGLARVVDMRIVMNATTSHRTAPHVGDPATANDLAATSIQLRVSGANVLVKASGNFATSAGHILLEYTKS
jgi:hypothetical protein